MRLPHQSTRARLGVLRSSSLRYAHTVPNTPIGTEIRNTARQSIGASRPPSTSPMKTPLTPTMLLMPSAIPRWLAGNASVRIAAELASRKAAPTPCTMRKTIRYSAPARPVIQSTVSNSEAIVYTRKPRLYIFTRPYMSPSRPRLTIRTLVTTRKPRIIHSR